MKVLEYAEKDQLRHIFTAGPPEEVAADELHDFGGADRAQIEQVLINLVQNAADSIEPPGTITLRVRQERLSLGAKETDAVILEVADTGAGIAPEVEKRLFDPFFTTKESATGLGLSIAARIVEKHGGALQYRTLVNRGTTFGIVLPECPPS